MSDLKVLMIQPRLHWQDPEQNRKTLEAQVNGSIGDSGCDLVLLPETFTTGFLGDVDRNPEGMDGPTVEWMRRMARGHDAAIGGSAVIVEDGKRYNRFLFVKPDGEVTHYDKRHLFSYGGEHTRYESGTERTVVTWREWRICLQVCYDLRFPVWCRNQNDYDLLVFVANWPAPRVNAWASLLRARAIENQACVIGINRVGKDGKGIDYPGLSAAYDAFGAELAVLGDEVESRMVTLDLGALRDLRRELPFLQDADRFTLD